VLDAHYRRLAEAADRVPDLKLRRRLASLLGG
jgi:hypothetical protein